jgi:hypothetical protein
MAIYYIFSLPSYSYASGVDYGRIIHAVPAHTDADKLGTTGRKMSPFHITISPNGDGIRDRATIRACVPKGSRPTLWVFYQNFGTNLPVDKEIFGSAQVKRIAGGCRPNEIRVQGVWDGRTPLFALKDRPQGGYRMMFCHGSTNPVGKSPYISQCSKHVAVQHRNVWVYAPYHRSFLPSQRIPIKIMTDAAFASVSLWDNRLEKRHRLWTGVEPGAFRYIVLPPDLEPGVYRIRVVVRGEIFVTPVSVRSRTISLTRPPVKTALMVMPSLTWMAYNRYDGSRDGIADSWYTVGTDKRVPGVRFYAPIISQNLHSQEHDYANISNLFSWLAEPTAEGPVGRSFQLITDYEFAALDQSVINKYSAIMFPSHTEYYTQAMYTKLMRYRSLGGNVVFLSANSFYRRIVINSGRLIPDWPTSVPCRCNRSSEASDYAIAGTGFRAFIRGKTPMYMTDTARTVAPWLFSDTTWIAGSRVGFAALEVDEPPSVPGKDTLHPLFIGSGTMPVATEPTSGIMFHKSGAKTLSLGNMNFLNNLSDERLPQDERRELRLFLDNVWSSFVYNNHRSHSARQASCAILPRKEGLCPDYEEEYDDDITSNKLVPLGSACEACPLASACSSAGQGCVS